MQLDTEGVAMTLTTEQVQVPETTSPAPSPRPGSPVRVLLRWAPVVVALGAAGLLAASVLTPDGGPARVDTSRTVAEFGSIAAIEHRDELAVLRQQSPSRTVAEHGSITAIDHRDGVTTRGPEAAIADHRRARQHRRHRPPRRTGAAPRSGVTDRRRARQHRRHRAPRRTGRSIARTLRAGGGVGGGIRTRTTLRSEGLKLRRSGPVGPSTSGSCALSWRFVIDRPTRTG